MEMLVAEVLIMETVDGEATVMGPSGYVGPGCSGPCYIYVDSHDQAQ